MVSWKVVKCFTAACISVFTWEEEVQEEEEEEVPGAVQGRAVLLAVLLAVLSAPWRRSLLCSCASSMCSPQRSSMV